MAEHEGTSLKLALDAQPFVENIDKSAAKIEEFSKRGEKAMNELGKSADNMSTIQKRAYDTLNSTMDRHQKEIAKISKEYEILREKQKNGVLSKDEAARLQALTKEYKTHAGAVATTAKELENLAKRFKSVKSAENQVKSVTPQVTHTFTNLALAIQGCKIAFDAAIEAIKSFGLAQEQQISQLAAMKAGVGDATEAYRLFNDAYRNTNYSQAGINTMTKSLLAIGLSAKEAAAMIGTVSDAAAGLGMDESGANQLLDLLKKLSTTDKFSSKDLKAFQQLGIDMGKIFGDALKMSTEDALKAIADNKVGGKDAFGTIVNYLNKEYKGAMADAKDNTIDAIGDIKGNVETAAGEIGAALIRALGFGGLAKDAVDATEKLVQVSRGINDTGDVWQSIANISGKEAANSFETWANTLGSIVSAGSFGYIAAGISEIQDGLDGTARVKELVSHYQDLQLALAGLSDTKNINVDKNIIGKQSNDIVREMGKTKEAIAKYKQISLDAFSETEQGIIFNAHRWGDYKGAIDSCTKTIRELEVEQKGLQTIIGTTDVASRTKEQIEAAEKLIKVEAAIAEATKMKESYQAASVKEFADETAAIIKNSEAVKKSITESRKLTAAKVAEIGVFQAASAATGEQIIAFTRLQYAELKAAYGAKNLAGVMSGSLIAGFKGLLAMAVTAFKAIGIAIAQFLLSPIGAAITALAALAGGIAYAYSKWKQWTREKELPINNMKAVEGLSKLDFGEGAISKVAAENTAKLERMQEAVKGIVTEDSRLATELKKLVEQAKDYEQQLSIGAIGQEEYARRMNAIYKSAENLKRELREIAGKNLANLDLVKASVEMQKTKISVDNLADSLDKLKNLTTNGDFTKSLESQIKSGTEELEKLGKQIDEVKRKLSEGDPGKESELLQTLSELQTKYAEVEKSVESYKQTQASVKKSLDSVAESLDELSSIQEALNEKYDEGIITEDEYKSEMEKLVAAAEGAKNGIAEVNLAVNAANVAMAEGVISAQEYAQAIASVATATAKIAAGQKGLSDALQNGGDVDYWKSYIASAAAEVAYERDQIQKMRDHISDYGYDGRGTKKEKPKDPTLKEGDGKTKTGGGGSKGESEAAKKFKQDKQYADQMRQLERENQRYLADLQEKTDAARMKNSEELAQNLLNLYKMTGAKEAAHQQQRVIRNKQMYAELSKLNSQYAKQLFETQQNLAQKQQDLLDAQKSKELGIITPEQYEKQKALLEKQIAMIDRSINDLLKSHKEDSISIQVKANLNQITDDLQYSLAKAEEKREYEKKGGGHITTADQISIAAEDKYRSADAAAMGNFLKNANSLSNAYTTGDADGIASIGRLIGMSDDDILAKGECISAMYQSVSEAMIAATTQEVDGFARTRDSALQHASALESAQKAAKDYAISVGKNLGDAFSDWITGAKTAKQAMEDFAANLIKQAAQILAEWLGVYAILLLCGSNPHDASRGASKAVLGIDTKADGGLVRGPGGPRSDSIPTMLSNGEYVINAAAVESIGKGNLDFMNRTGHMADGGIVGGEDNLISSGTTMIINAMDALSFQDFLEFRGIQGIKQVMRNESRRFATNTGTF